MMDTKTPLRTSEDVSQSLQREIEGLAEVVRAFMHVNYQHDHDVHQERKPPHDDAPIRTLRD